MRARSGCLYFYVMLFLGNYEILLRNFFKKQKKLHFRELTDPTCLPLANTSGRGYKEYSPHRGGVLP